MRPVVEAYSNGICEATRWDNSKERVMRSNFASAVLTALLYAQGLLGLAGVATVMLKDRAETVSMADTVDTMIVSSIATN